MDRILGGNTFVYSTPAHTNSPDTSGHRGYDHTEDILTEESHAVNIDYLFSNKLPFKNSLVN